MILMICDFIFYLEFCFWGEEGSGTRMEDRKWKVLMLGMLDVKQRGVRFIFVVLL